MKSYEILMLFLFAVLFAVIFFLIGGKYTLLLYLLGFLVGARYFRRTK